MALESAGALFFKCLHFKLDFLDCVWLVLLLSCSDKQEQLCPSAAQAGGINVSTSVRYSRGTTTLLYHH